jgi:hypothetical protein
MSRYGGCSTSRVLTSRPSDLAVACETVGSTAIEP